jgi:catechol 2,3-dioxygenase-like lactoylglutathione lyase family enzyme
MKALSITVLATLGAACLFGQLAPPNDAGVRLGHIHLLVKDVAAQERFWVDVIGGKAVKNGPLTLIEFPNVYIMLRQGDPSGPPAGSVVDHFGLVFRDLPAMMAKWKAAGIKVEQLPGNNPLQGYFNAPDGVRTEFFGDPMLPVPVRMDHVHLAATDIPAMQAWYQKVFGMAPGKRPRVSTPGWVDCNFLPGDITWSYAARDKAGVATKGRSVDHVGFDVKSLDAFAEKLATMGLKFDAPPRQIQGVKTRVAFFTDPWGTCIEVTENLEPPAH